MVWWVISYYDICMYELVESLHVLFYSGRREVVVFLLRFCNR